LSRRSRIVGFGSAGLLVIAGIACAFAFSGELGQNLAFGLVAFGLVEGTALVFYEVGLTEDRDREREDRARASRAGPGEGGQPARPPLSHGPHETDQPGRRTRPRIWQERDRSHPSRPKRLR
jgi:hypothetical protein